MSNVDENPFLDPSIQQLSPHSTQNENNPFTAQTGSQDPSIQQLSPHSTQNENNPFTAQTGSQYAVGQPTQAVTISVNEFPPPYQSIFSPASTERQQWVNRDDLQRRQDELEQRATELEHRDQSVVIRECRNNFPPLPANCCVGPCFYQDIQVDIPLQYQRTVRLMYYLWLAYVCLLLLNVIGALAYFIVSFQDSSTNFSGVTFGVSIFFVLIYTPLSFVCWFRPLYKAFRLRNLLQGIARFEFVSLKFVIPN